MANKNLNPAGLKEAVRFLKVRYGAMFADMSGSIGGGVVAKNKGGPYMRRRVKPLNPTSTYSANVRNIFTSISSGWSALTDAQRTSWNEGAKQHPVSSALGEQTFMSGKAWYQRLNQNLALVGGTAITDFPQLISVGSLLITSLVADASAQSVILGFNPTVPTDTAWIVNFTPQLSPGVSSMGVRDRTVITLPDGTTSPQTLSADYLGRFPATLVEGQRIFCKITPISTVTGQAGIPIQTAIFVTA